MYKNEKEERKKRERERDEEFTFCDIKVRLTCRDTGCFKFNFTDLCGRSYLLVIRYEGCKYQICGGTENLFDVVI